MKKTAVIILNYNSSYVPPEIIYHKYGGISGVYVDSHFFCGKCRR